MRLTIIVANYVRITTKVGNIITIETGGRIVELLSCSLVKTVAKVYSRIRTKAK